MEGHDRSGAEDGDHRRDGPQALHRRRSSGLASLAAFLAQTLQETIQYDACDENNWSDAAVAAKAGGDVYPATACGQASRMGTTSAAPITDESTGQVYDGADVEGAIDPNMVSVARTTALVRRAQALFCAPTSMIAEAPKWDNGGWCPSTGASLEDVWAAPLTRPRCDVFFGPYPATDHVPPEVLATKTDYIEYLKGAIDSGSGEACLMEGSCCMDYQTQKAGSWKSCPVGQELGQPKSSGR